MDLQGISIKVIYFLSSILMPQWRQSSFCYYISFSICLTKMDILDSFDEIKIGIAYRLDGKVLDSMPGQQN